MSGLFDCTVALVTGGGSEVGRVTALFYTRAGLKVLSGAYIPVDGGYLTR